jgi:hypothetical protein
MIRIVEIVGVLVAAILLAALYVAKSGTASDSEKLAQLQAELAREREAGSVRWMRKSLIRKSLRTCAAWRAPIWASSRCAPSRSWPFPSCRA